MSETPTQWRSNDGTTEMGSQTQSVLSSIAGAALTTISGLPLLILAGKATKIAATGWNQLGPYFDGLQSEDGDYLLTEAGDYLEAENSVRETEPASEWRGNGEYSQGVATALTTISGASLTTISGAPLVTTGTTYKPEVATIWAQNDSV